MNEKVSVLQVDNLSYFPPIIAQETPNTRAIKELTIDASIPIKILLDNPFIHLQNISLPIKSVPNKCCKHGLINFAE